MLDNKKVIEALHTIQNICINTDCDIDCPFADNTGICLLFVNEFSAWQRL